MSTHLTFNAPTKLWTLTGAGIIDYPSTVDADPGGPYVVASEIVPFDPVRQTGGSFWRLADGPYAGYLVSAHSNSLGYGDITIEIDDDPGTPGGDIPHINPLADWRVLIKGMGGAGSAGTHSVTFNADTQLWSRTSTGIISYVYDIDNGCDGTGTLCAAPGGPYKVIPTTVPFDPIHETGGSFWVLKEGPHVGFLVSAHTNSLGYGDITVDSDGMDRGPGATLAVLYHPNPHLAGGSKLYNRGGEFHFTLLVDDPNIRVPIPKQTHYALEFWNSDTEEWVEVLAGLIWDVDATETEAIFYGIDYLALLQFIQDERFDPSRPDRPVPNGSKYVAKTITQIVTSQLQYSINQLDSPVGFISIGDIAAMPYNVTIYSTLQDSLSFIVGLLDSHRAGTGKMTELRVVKTGDGEYEFVVEDDPGVLRAALALEYGVLAQGYKIREFDRDWASRVNMIGRDPTGRSTALRFQSIQAPRVQALWGRIAGPPQIVESVDAADLRRRALQAAIDASRLGRKVGIGTKLGSYRPFEAYNLLDNVPVLVDHGAIDTQAWSNDQFTSEADEETEDPGEGTTGLWAIIGIQWESYDDGHWITSPLLYPRGKGNLKYGEVSGAFSSVKTGGSDAGAVPILPEPTVPGKSLIAFIIIGGNTTVFPTSAIKRDDPAVGVEPSLEWDVIASATADYSDMNIVGPSATAGVYIEVAWRKVFDGEVTQTPVQVDLPASGISSCWLYQVPDTIIPAFVDSFNTQHVSGNPEHFAFGTSHTGNLYGLAVMMQADYGNQPEGLTPDDGITTITSASAANDPLLNFNHGWRPPWVLIGQMADGGTFGWEFDPISAYTSANAAAVLVKLPAGIDLPSIPYPANQVTGDLLVGLDTGAGDPPPPADGSGYGPPGPDTPATSTYTDILTGQQYTFDSDTGTWTPVSGTSYSDSGFYEFTFSSAASWVVTHSLTGHPQVTLVNSSEEIIEADVVYTSTTVITITFSEAVAGKVYLR